MTPRLSEKQITGPDDVRVIVVDDPRSRRVLRALLPALALASLGGGGLVPDLPRRCSPLDVPPWRYLEGYTPPSRPEEDQERIRLALEKRARKAAKLEAMASKGAIRRAE